LSENDEQLMDGIGMCGCEKKKFISTGKRDICVQVTSSHAPHELRTNVSIRDEREE
jgi:hypothetical protein